MKHQLNQPSKQALLDYWGGYYYVPKEKWSELATVRFHPLFKKEKHLIFP